MSILLQMFSPVARGLRYQKPWNHLPTVSLALNFEYKSTQEVRIEQTRKMASNTVEEKFQLPKRLQGSTPSVW